MGIIDCHFAYASLIWYITIKADGIILSPLHSYQILSIASFFYSYKIMIIKSLAMEEIALLMLSPISSL